MVAHVASLDGWSFKIFNVIYVLRQRHAIHFDMGHDPLIQRVPVAFPQVDQDLQKSLFLWAEPSMKAPANAGATRVKAKPLACPEKKTGKLKPNRR